MSRYPKTVKQRPTPVPMLVRRLADPDTPLSTRREHLDATPLDKLLPVLADDRVTLRESEMLVVTRRVTEAYSCYLQALTALWRHATTTATRHAMVRAVLHQLGVRLADVEFAPRPQRVATAAVVSQVFDHVDGATVFGVACEALADPATTPYRTARLSRAVCRLLHAAWQGGRWAATPDDLAALLARLPAAEDRMFVLCEWLPQLDSLAPATGPAEAPAPASPPPPTPAPRPRPR